MPLESAQYIHQLEPSNPAPTDQLRQADDHIRLIKQTIQDTFPNITGPVEADQDSLNGLFSMPIGIIQIWYGIEAEVPSGYAICAGQTVARSDGDGNIVLPDLRGKVVIGAGTLVPQGTAYGNPTSTGVTDSQGAHTHTVPGVGAHTHGVTLSGTTGGTAATVTVSPTNGSGYDAGGGTGTPVLSATASSPSHTHTVSLTGTTDSGSSGGGDSGSSGAHTHAVSGVSTFQPSLGLHYIMKV